MTMLTRRRVVLAKIETSYGVDPTPSGSVNAILCKNLNITPVNTNVVARETVRPYLGNYEQLNADTHVTIDFEVEIAGAGAAGSVPAYGPLLRACGLSETISAGVSVVYAPISSGFESVTLYFNNDGVVHKITGTRGTVEIMINARQIPVYKFNFTGLYNAPVSGALPSVDYSHFQEPLIANNSNTTGFEFFSYAPILEALTFNLTNQINYRTLIGSESVQLLDRKIAGSVTFEAVNPSVKDYFQIAQSNAQTLGDLQITHGVSAGNKVSLQSSRIDIVNPTYNDNSGVQMLQVPFVAIPSSAGNDEFTLTVF